MAAGCGASCAKMLLFIFNAVFFLCGAGMLAMGIWFIVAEENSYFTEILGGYDNSDPLLSVAAYVVIGVGGLIFIVGFLGCCGACMESKCMLIMYTIFLVVLLAAEITAAILAIVYQSDIEAELNNEILDSLQYYGLEDQKAFTEAWDKMQQGQECCGYNDSGDWDGDIPWSCCENANEGDACSSGDAFTAGCKDKIVAWIEDNMAIIVGVAFAVVGVEIFGIIFAICLSMGID